MCSKLPTRYETPARASIDVSSDSPRSSASMQSIATDAFFLRAQASVAEDSPRLRPSAALPVRL